MTQPPDIEHIPWTKVNDYLTEIGNSKTKEQFCEGVVSGLARLIPFDVSGLFQVLGPTLCQRGMSDASIKAYESHYQYRLPWFVTPKQDPLLPGEIALLDWRLAPYRDWEFVTDFLVPNGVQKSVIGTLPGGGLAIAIHRAPMALNFTGVEYAILSVLSPHIQNFYNSYDEISRLSNLVPTQEEIAKHHSGLSHRETEIAAYLCQGLAVGDIATRLFISKRTVEAHIENLYEKLNVHDKKTAIERLTSQK